MKKRVIMLLLAGCLTVGTLFTGCGSQENMKKTPAAAEVQKEEDSEGDEKEEKKVEKTEEKEEDKEKKKSAKGDVPVLGSEEAEGYEGFSYLYEELLMTASQEDEDGKLKNEKVHVFIPKDDYSSVDRDYAYSEKMGVSFRITLNPYIQYEQEDYSAAENMEAFMEDEYDEFYSTDYKDLEISEVEEAGKDTAVATAKYCEYDSWEDEYRAVFNTYCLKEVKPDVTVLIEVAVNSSETTDKTEDLLAEIEAFYEFDVDWDREEAEKKLEEFLANDDGEAETVSTGFIKFDLPKDWKEDRENSSYQTTVYAPGGDSDLANCGIGILREYVGDGAESISELLTDRGYAEEFVASQLGDDASDVSIEEYGTTCIGETALIECKVDMDGEDAQCGFYMGGKNGYLYAVIVIEGYDCEYDAFGVAEDILENGKVNE